MVVLVAGLVVASLVAAYVWIDVRMHRRLMRHLERLDRERRR
jgi:uncharacterized membrane protein YciS (DUF1049 family)